VLLIVFRNHAGDPGERDWEYEYGTILRESAEIVDGFRFFLAVHKLTSVNQCAETTRIAPGLGRSFPNLARLRVKSISAMIHWQPCPINKTGISYCTLPLNMLLPDKGKRSLTAINPNRFAGKSYLKRFFCSAAMTSSTTACASMSKPAGIVDKSTACRLIRAYAVFQRTLWPAFCNICPRGLTQSPTPI